MQKYPPVSDRGIPLFGVIQVEVAVIVELLALLCALPRLAVVGVELIVQVHVPGTIAVSTNQIRVLLQRVILLVTHVSDQQDQTQPCAFIASATFRKPAMFAPAM